MAEQAEEGSEMIFCARARPEGNAKESLWSCILRVLCCNSATEGERGSLILTDGVFEAYILTDNLSVRAIHRGHMRRSRTQDRIFMQERITLKLSKLLRRGDGCGAAQGFVGRQRRHCECLRRRWCLVVGRENALPNVCQEARQFRKRSGKAARASALHANLQASLGRDEARCCRRSMLVIRVWQQSTCC